MNNTTYMARKNEVESKWYIIDASQKPLGRIAAEAAKLADIIMILINDEKQAKL